MSSGSCRPGGCRHHTTSTMPHPLVTTVQTWSDASRGPARHRLRAGIHPTTATPLRTRPSARRSSSLSPLGHLRRAYSMPRGLVWGVMWRNLVTIQSHPPSSRSSRRAGCLRRCGPRLQNCGAWWARSSAPVPQIPRQAMGIKFFRAGAWSALRSGCGLSRHGNTYDLALGVRGYSGQPLNSVVSPAFRLSLRVRSP